MECFPPKKSFGLNSRKTDGDVNGSAFDTARSDSSSSSEASEMEVAAMVGGNFSLRERRLFFGGDEKTWSLGNSGDPFLGMVS